jgi:excisionase family DNA binding protein
MISIRAPETVEPTQSPTFDIEPFVDDETAAKFLSVSPRHLKDLARAGKLPAHMLGDGPRKTWRFRLTELAIAMQACLNCNRQFPAPKGAI